MKLVLCFLICSSIFVSHLLAASVILQPGDDGQDAIIRSHIKSENNNLTWLYTRNDDPFDLYWTAIKFDISSIPVQTVNQAVMELYCYIDETTGSPAIYANRITADWNEDTINWNSHGAAYTADGRATQTGTVGIGWISWDVTFLVSEWLNPSNGIDNHGLMLTTDNMQPDNRLTYYASEYSDDPSLRPKLTLDFDEPQIIPEPATLLLIISGLLAICRGRLTIKK